MQCQDCEGETMPDHPGGLLAIAHRTGCEVYLQEDATRAADYERGLNGWRLRGERPATPTERDLLGWAGHEHLPADLQTSVCIDGAVYRRTWPDLGIE